MNTKYVNLLRLLAKNIVYRDNRLLAILKEELTKHLNDDKLYYILAYHELASFLYASVKSDKTLKKIAETIKPRYYFGLIKYSFMQEEMLNIIKSARQRKLLLVPIKGLSYASIYYKRFGFRPISDIDLLVKEKHLQEAVMFLKDIGYKQDTSGGKETYWRQKQCHFGFIKKSDGGKILAELHWALDFKRGKKEILPEAWKRIKNIKINGLTVPILSPEDSILSLSLHQRRFGRVLNLKYICDIGLMLNKENLNWEYIIAAAHKEKMRSSLYFILRQTEIVLELNLSDIIKKLKISPFKKLIISTIIKHFTFNPPGYHATYMLYLICHLLIYDNLRYPVMYILNIPQEQFAKFFNLPLYSKTTNTLYKIRFIYMPAAVISRALKNILRLLISKPPIFYSRKTAIK